MQACRCLPSQALTEAATAALTRGSATTETDATLASLIQEATRCLGRGQAAAAVVSGYVSCSPTLQAAVT